MLAKATLFSNSLLKFMFPCSVREMTKFVRRHKTYPVVFRLYSNSSRNTAINLLEGNDATVKPNDFEATPLKQYPVTLIANKQVANAN